jgi:asparagine synthase (glutamine-hydrolysing)
MADGFASVPHIQDWPAVFELRKQQLIPRDSVFVPGIRAPYNLQPAWSKTGVVKHKEILSSIHKTFYPLRDWARQRVDLKRQIDEKILRLLGNPPLYTTEEASNAYEWWWWQGRESRFIVNSMRVYEFWGYEWWLPLWDLEIAVFWSKVPMTYKVGKKLQISHLQKLELGILQRNIRLCGTSSRGFTFASGLLRKTRFYDRTRRLHGLTQYNRHPLAWYGIIPRQWFNDHYSNIDVINAYLAIEMFQRIFPGYRRLELFGDINSSNS